MFMAGIRMADSVRLDRRTGYQTGYKPLRAKAKAGRLAAKGRISTWVFSLYER
jgi:hypothetical protein